MASLVCFEDETYFKLVETIVQRIRDADKLKPKKWLSGEEVMEILHIKSKTTLQDLRDEGKLRYSQPEKKKILYDSDSVEEYLKQNIKNTF